jgi:uracil phosphoribosyltransferase
MFILDEKDSIANEYLKDLRDSQIQRDRLRFRKNLKRIGLIMAYEISSELSYRNETIITPIKSTDCRVLYQQPVLVTILRAGIPFYEGFLEIFDRADSGFIGSYRATDGSHEEVNIVTEYSAIPPVSGRDVILIDPMLATGRSILSVVDQLKEKGLPRHIFIASVISAPEGIEFLKKELRMDYSIWTGSLDEHLNNKAYIVPGLGDAGDLAFGPKH